MRRLLCCFVLLCLFPGCSTTFTYNQLDWLIPWYMNDYVDLTREQKRQLRARLEPVLYWHRYEELQEYVILIERIEKDTRGKVHPGTVKAWLDEAMAAADRIEFSLLQMAIDTGESLNDEQVDDFIESLWQRQAELEEKYLERSDEEYRRDNFRSLKKNMRRFTGKLTPVQEDRLRQSADRLIRFDTVWLEDRNRWLQKLERLLQRQPGWQDAIIQAYGERVNERPPDYDTAMSHNINVISEAIAGMLNNLSDEQQSRLTKKLAALKNDLVTLQS